MVSMVIFSRRPSHPNEVRPELKIVSVNEPPPNIGDPPVAEHPQIPKDHLQAVVDNILEGRLIPFFGAGVNLCGYPDDEWTEGGTTRLPSGSELSKHLALKYKYPEKDNEELARVSQYAGLFKGLGDLYEELHSLFDQSFAPTSLHKFFAKLPRECLENGYPEGGDPARKHLLIVTTNYDDLMERAFLDAKQKFHVVTYLAGSSNHDVPVFLHRPPDDRPPVVITQGNTYAGLNDDPYPIILKIHGAVDRSAANSEFESFVITEDNYIDYISRGDLTGSIPMAMRMQLLRGSFLFLGYGLRDWNLRAFLLRLWRLQGIRNYRAWSVNHYHPPLEKLYLDDKKIGFIPAKLDSYVKELDVLFSQAVNRRA